MFKPIIAFVCHRYLWCYMGLRLDFSYTFFKDKKNPAKVKMFDSF